MINLSLTAMVCVEFQQVQYINLSELIHLLKTIAIMTSEHLYLSTISVVGHFLIAIRWPMNGG